jgi:hypothetical protein
MPESKTRLKHICPTGEPFDCTEGDLSGGGFLVVVDKRTHELVIPRERETEEAVTLIVRPKGGAPLVEEPPALAPVCAVVEREMAESARRGLELFWRRRRGRVRGGAVGAPQGSKG